MHQGALPQYWGCLELHAAIGHALSSLSTVWSNSAVFSKKVGVATISIPDVSYMAILDQTLPYSCNAKTYSSCGI